MKHLAAILFFVLCAQFAPGLPSNPVFAGEWQVMPLATKPTKNTNMNAIGADGLATKGEGFQYVFALTYSPSDPQRAYLGVDTTGVWRSDDGGQNWYPTFTGFDANGAVSVAVDPVNPDIVLAAGFFGFERKRSEVYPDRIQGIYRTVNGGKTWTMTHPTGFYRRFGKGTLFVFVPSASDHAQSTSKVFSASSDEGLLQSDDNGLSWKRVRVSLVDGKGIGEIHDLKLAPGSSGKEPELLAVTEKGLFRIIGTKAEKIGKGLAEVAHLTFEAREKTGPMTIAVSPADPSVMLVACGEKGIWRSTDRGATFTQTSFSGTAWVKNAALTPRITDVALSPIDANIAYARAHFIALKPMYSHDGGKTWKDPKETNLDKLLPREGFYFSSPFAPHPLEAKTALHVTNGRERIVRTADGGVNWRYSGRGYSGAALAYIAFASSEEFYVGLVDYGLWYTNDNGYSFSEIAMERIFGSQTIGAMDVRINPDKSRTILLSLGQWVKRGLAISHNGGQSWDYNDKIITSKGIAFLHPEDHNFMLISGHLSRNGGKKWEKLGNAITGDLICHFVDKKNGYTLYALGDNNKKAVVYKSADLGRTWSQASAAVHIPSSDIRAMSVSPLGIYIATTGGIFHSSGKSLAEQWYKFENFPKDKYGSMFSNSIAINPKNPNEIWVGCTNPGRGRGQGLVMSRDAGKNWQQVDNSNAPLFTITKVFINPFDNTVYAGTFFGTYRLKR